MQKAVCLVVASALSVICLDPTARAATVSVTHCGQEIRHGDKAVLAADLDCSGPGLSDAQITLDSARLDLNGHTIRGNIDAVVLCKPKAGVFGCSINGPGAIVGGDRGVQAYGTNVRVAGLTLANSTSGIESDGRVEVRNVTSDNVDNGVVGKHVVAFKLVVTRCHSLGVVAASLRIAKSTITGCQEAGISVGRSMIVDSVLTGGLFDIQATAKPHLVRTTCDRSISLTTGTPFGVCRLDP